MPLLDALVGQAVHQVDADVVEPRAESLMVGAGGVFGCVAAAESMQEFVVETLHAYAQPIYAAVEIRRKLALAEVAGISLQSYFSVRFEIEDGADRVHNMVYVRSWKVGRGAAAEEDRMKLRAVEEAAPQGNFGLQRSDIQRHKGLDGGVGVEVAVRALGLAERDVYVEGR